MMNPKYLQEDIKKIYTVLKKLMPNIRSESIVAGGAIRDWDNDVDIKDIDIWISTETDVFREDLDRVFGKGSWKEKSEHDYVDGSILSVIEVQGPHCPVDIIFINRKYHLDVRPIINEFDIDFCKIYYDPAIDRVVYTKEYMTNQATKTITGTDNDSDHAERIAKKYPEFKLDLEEDYDISATVSFGY